MVSSVYHNRSDQFCRYIIDQQPQPDWLHLRDNVLREMGCNDKTGDEDPEQILRNQALATLGLHNIREGLPVGRIKSGAPLSDILAQQDIDIVLMDNHMDLGARLWVDAQGGVPYPFFMRTDYVPGFKSRLELAPYLSAEQSAEYNLRIANYFKKLLPNTEIVFLHFPINKNKAQDRRVAMTWEFADTLGSKIKDVKPFYVNESYHTATASHFTPEVYFAMAGSVRAIIERC